MKTIEYPDKEIIEMYQSGLSSAVIAKKFGFSSGTILNRLKKNNIPRRNVEEAARKHFFNEDFFTEIDTEAKAYFLGFIIADGSVDEKRRKVAIAISTRDEEILFKFAKEIGVDTKIIQYETPLRGFSIFTKIARVSLISKRLIEGLVKLGIHQNKTFTVKCPDVQEDMKPHLWRGILEGDGWVSLRYVKDGNLPILECGICGNLFLMNDFSKLLDFLNIKHKIGKDKTIYRIKLNGERGLKFLNYLYKSATIFLDRKKNLFDLYLVEKEKQAARNVGKTPGIYKSEYNTFSSYSIKKSCGIKKRLGSFKTLEEAVEAQNKFHLEYVM